MLDFCHTLRLLAVHPFLNQNNEKKTSKNEKSQFRVKVISLTFLIFWKKSKSWLWLGLTLWLAEQVCILVVDLSFDLIELVFLNLLSWNYTILIFYHNLLEITNWNTTVFIKITTILGSYLFALYFLISLLK